jgi:hypothetical protein
VLSPFAKSLPNARFLSVIDVQRLQEPKSQDLAKGQCERIVGLILRNMTASGEPMISTNARCLSTMIPIIMPIPVPAAIGMDRNKTSIAIPLMLPAAASIIHFCCLRFINQLPFHAPPMLVARFNQIEE